MNSDADVKPPRELTPAFYGCYDWHSSVHGHWLLVRLTRLSRMRRSPRRREPPWRATSPRPTSRAKRSTSPDGRASFERPYGLAWLLQLAAELQGMGRSQAREWAAALRPLEAGGDRAHLAWLPKLSHPIRTGEHNNTAFGLGLMLDYARVTGESRIRDSARVAPRDYYVTDRAAR